MPESPTPRVPSECSRCGWPGTVRLQRTLQGERVLFLWCCIACNAEWPVQAEK